MTKYVINQFHFHGTFIAGDNFDIHDNTSVNLYQGEYSKETTAHETYVEDVTPVQENKTVEKQTLPFLVIDKLTELGTYSILEFEALYHQAVKGGAPKLAKFLKHYIDLNVLDTKDLNKKETFEKLKAFFGDELNYEYPNFAAYY